MFKDASARVLDRAKATHDRFNVFTTLLDEHDEVRLHTRFIHCLLNPKGLHDCDQTLLDLFFETLAERPGLDREGNPTAFTPPSSGPWTVDKEVSCPDGQLDILIRQETHFGIVIENKIHAEEQDKQLEGYARYLSKHFGSKAIVLYLTLHGDQSRTHKGTVPYVRISYAEHILHWLDKCLRETCRIIPINPVLLQYRDVVRHLTGKSIPSETMNDITDYIAQNPDIIRYRAGIIEAIESTRANYVERLAEGIIKELKAKGYTIDCKGRFSSDPSGALIISPPENSNLHRMPIKMWVEKHPVHGLFIGIKCPSGYKNEVPIADQNVLEQMDRILDESPQTQNKRQLSPNNAWPAGWFNLVNPFDDNQLADLVNKDPALIATDMCNDICRLIELHDQAYVKASSCPAQSDLGALG